MGLMLLLFGIFWIGFAWSQPIPVYTICSNGGAVPGIPQCGMPGPLAQLFYALGTLASIIGVAALFLRWYLYQQTPTTVRTIIKPTELPGGSTPPSFLKKCPECGRELPIAAEKCYSCGARA